MSSASTILACGRRINGVTADQVRWSKSPLTQPMCRSADQRTIRRASVGMTLSKLPYRRSKSNLSTWVRDPVHDRARQREPIRVAPHEAHRGAVGVREDRVARQEHALAVRAGRPVHDGASRKVAARLGERHPGEDLQLARPRLDRRHRAAPPSAGPSPRRAPALRRAHGSTRPARRTCGGGSPRSPSTGPR